MSFPDRTVLIGVELNPERDTITITGSHSYVNKFVDEQGNPTESQLAATRAILEQEATICKLNPELAIEIICTSPISDHSLTGDYEVTAVKNAYCNGDPLSPFRAHELIESCGQLIGSVLYAIGLKPEADFIIESSDGKVAPSNLDKTKRRAAKWLEHLRNENTAGLK